MQKHIFKFFLAKKKLQAFIVSQKHNIGYLSNFWGSFGILLVTSNKIRLFTDSRYFEEAKKIVSPKIEICDYKRIKQYLNKDILIGYEANDVSVSQIKNWQKQFPKAHFRITIDTVENLRISKTQQEIQEIQKAAKLSDKVLDIIRNQIKLGITEKELQWEIIKIAYNLGAEKMAFSPIVSFGKHTAHPHHKPSQKKLCKKDIILIDLGVKMNKYCSDMTRMFFTAPPTNLQKKIFQIVFEAQQQAIKKIKINNILCSQIDYSAREYIKNAGYGEYFEHSLGHGVGLMIHESPSLSQKNSVKFPNNSVFTIEPGIYLPGKFGIRLEDLFSYSSNKLVQLSKYTKNIEELTLNLSK